MMALWLYILLDIPFEMIYYLWFVWKGSGGILVSEYWSFLMLDEGSLYYSLYFCIRILFYFCVCILIFPIIKTMIKVFKPRKKEKWKKKQGMKKSGFNYLFLRETEALKHLQVNYETWNILFSVLREWILELECISHSGFAICQLYNLGQTTMSLGLSFLIYKKEYLQNLRGYNKLIIYKALKGLPGSLVVKNLPANAGNIGLIPGVGRSHMRQSN